MSSKEYDLVYENAPSIRIVDVDEPMPEGWTLRLILYPNPALSSLGVGYKEEGWPGFKEYHRFDQGVEPTLHPIPEKMHDMVRRYLAALEQYASERKLHHDR